MQFVADQSVTWSLSTDSTGTISAGGLYTAPQSFIAKNIWLGSQLLPNDHIYNTRIDSVPINSSINTYFHNNLVGIHANFLANLPENVYTNSTPQSSLIFNYSPTANGNFPILGLADIGVENGLFSDFNQVDQHILGSNTQTSQFSEVYKLYPIGANSTCLTCNSQSGVKYSPDYALSVGVDAAGMYLAPLAIRYSELRACADGGPAIKHALRFSLTTGHLASSKVWPATAFATDGGTIPFGTRFRLRANVDISAYPASVQCILTALKQYGMFIVDGGLNMQISAMQDMPGDYQLFNDVVKGFNVSNNVSSDEFDALDESSLQDLNPNSPTYQSGRVSTNAYVTPEQFAVVIASNTSTHQSTQMPLILRPVTIGTDRAIGYSFMAGTPATQLNVWVNGALNTAFSCSMTPTTGTLTSGGLYTPPTSVLVRTTSTVTCTASADPAVKTSFPLAVYSSTGIRVSLGQASNNNYGPDTNGNIWYKDLASFWRLQGRANCDFSYLPQNPWNQTTPNIGLYYNCEYIKDGSGDLRYKFYVPNGTYRITLLFGIGGTGAFTLGQWNQGIDSQGEIYASTMTATMTGNGPWTELGLTGKSLDLCNLLSNCLKVTPGRVVLDENVTDNTLYFAIRHIAPVGVSQPASVLSAFSVEPINLFLKTGISGGATITGGAEIH